MSIATPFQALSNTVCIATTAAASTPAALSDTETLQDMVVQYRVYNAAGADMCIVFTAASANAVFPTAGTPKTGFVMPNGAIEVFTAPPGVFISTITTGAGGNVYVTAGIGV